MFAVESDDGDFGAAHMTVNNFSFTAVPEPHEYAMFSALGLAGFAVWRRKFKNRCATVAA